MKSGAPAFGTPEYTRAALAGGQLARRYKLPYRSSNACAANAVDAQAAYEVGDVDLGRGHGRRQHGEARRRLDGGRPRRLVREADRRCRDAADDGASSCSRSWSTTTRWRSTPSPRSAPAATSSAPQHTLARYETAFYAPIAVRLAQLRDLARGRRARHRPARQRHLEAAAGRFYQPPPLDPAIARRSRTSSHAARPKAASRRRKVTSAFSKALSTISQRSSLPGLARQSTERPGSASSSLARFFVPVDAQWRRNRRGASARWIAGPSPAMTMTKRLLV